MFKQRDLSRGSGASTAWELSQALCSQGAGSPGAKGHGERDN